MTVSCVIQGGAGSDVNWQRGAAAMASERGSSCKEEHEEVPRGQTHLPHHGPDRQGILRKRAAAHADYTTQ
eukprot:9473299-Pyramimonas_sp.AAC.1